MDNERDNYENNNSARGLAGSLLDAAADRKVRQDNIDAIKNRQGKNEPIRPKTDEDESAPKEKSGLDKKDELENKKDTKDIKEDSEPKKHRNLDDFKKESLDRLTGIDKLKKNWAKIAIVSKVAMFLIGILVSLSFVLLIFAALIGTYDVFSNGLSNFFGLPESDTSNGSRDGLYTSTKYKYDQDGNELNAVELVQTLKEDSNCDFSGWSYFKDWLSGNKIEDPCKFIRYIKKETVDSDNGVDPSLVIATIFYAYDTEPLTVQYDYPEEIPKNRISSMEHFETLKRILDTKDNEFTTDTLDTIIKNSYITRNSYYYTWEVDDSKEDEVSGSCKVTPGPKTKEYSLDKWKIFMRFGSDLAEKYDKSFDVGYLKESSDEECNGSISDSDLKTRLGGLKENANVVVDTSSARNAMQEKSENLNGILCHADVDSKAKDDCSPYDYRSGFVYNNFLGYKNSFSEYDEIFTPKNIEYTINEIVSKKTLLNEALLLEDKDTDPINGGTSVGPVVVGAYCKDYLKTPLANIKVDLRDCYGKKLDTISFEDYIIGVANAEVSDKNANYVLSEMLAAISYALKRNNNYTKGETIRMRSGTCDQAYCSPKLGCTVVRNPDVCSGCMSFYIGGSRGKNPKLYSKYREYYGIASQFLVVSNGKVHNAHYVSTIQNEWYKKASEGMAFTQIIAETYAKEGAEVVKCSTGEVNEESPTTKTVVSGRVGDKKTSEYPNVAPDRGKFYGYSYANLSSNNIKINPLWVKENIVEVSPNCKDKTFVNMTFKVHKDALSNFNRAFDGICKLITDGVRLSNGSVCKLSMNNLQGGTVFMEKKLANGYEDLHSYGITQDWNYNASYNINGKIYKPYSSSASYEDYWDFVEAINQGKSDLYNEENCANINYILYKYAYEPADFSWGYGHLGKKDNKGNFVSGSFNGKSFVINY